jgi:four helix bundle protein
MAPIASYRDLIAWQKAMQVAEHCHALADRLPREELFGLAAQMRRAAVSVPSNIAEGQRRTTAGFRDFLRIALASLAELETHLELAARFGYLSRDDVEQMIRDTEELARVIHGLRAALARKAKP